jgi:glycosyltransferase involved in cell wall biosynthesis
MGFNIAWLGELGFPVGWAGVQKIILIFKGTRQYGVNGIVINTFGFHDRESTGMEIKTEGVHEGIRYIHASGSPYRPKNFFIRNILKVWGVIHEVFILYKLRRKGQLDAAILHVDKFTSTVFYRILSKLFGFPLIMLYVELYSSLSTRKSLKYKINVYLFEKYGFFFIDGIIPISDYLYDLVKSRNPQLPMINVPMLTDFDRFNGVERNIGEKYFLFCSASTYLEIIFFILKAFELLESLEEVWLYLVVHGPPDEMARLKEEISKNRKRDLIKVFSRISDTQLTELYASASGLLIPLRPTIQDKARFPHKIGEYLASGNPIVTTNYGEVAKYFKDEESALIARNYDVAEFSEKMKYIILNPEKAKDIGQKGRQVGLANFDYKVYGSKVKEFIHSIILQKKNRVFLGT